MSDANLNRPVRIVVEGDPCNPLFSSQGYERVATLIVARLRHAGFTNVRMVPTCTAGLEQLLTERGDGLLVFVSRHFLRLADKVRNELPEGTGVLVYTVGMVEERETRRFPNLHYISRTDVWDDDSLRRHFGT